MSSDPDFEHDLAEDHDSESFGDSKEAAALALVRQLFAEYPDRVFFTRQIEIRFEKNFYHWITNRAIHRLYQEGAIDREATTLKIGSPITLWWNKKKRYQKRPIRAVLDLVNEYSNPRVSECLGLHGQQMILGAFARSGFHILAEDANEFRGRKWIASNHNLDFIIERDGRCYGVEVKNTLGYIRKEEFELKTRLAQDLGLTPMFVVRMMPGDWIWRLKKMGGFVLALRYQLYPLAYQDLATRIKERFELPVDTPRRLYDATMQRVVDWHDKRSVN